ncbi:chromate transporter [Paenibacillus chondroitinus]|uniref:Chromate transporter n=1 Tax=Paenibacillus chondroitinus TaxID=59842 RepID=A0ABU6DG81_9BACL|nr:MULTISPECIES: chromate transporter [Paenibacillus]MCY9661057.1 chromate transporter [Paenibacillus anseongense]MEB4796780.1 chromate transporter [Paenibacillus chondroitinus]
MRVGNTYVQIGMAMLRTGILGYGGGPSIVPLIRYEAVTRFQWMKDEEFMEVLAIANTLPGPIATKLAGYLGYRLKGTAGAAVGVLAHILPTCVAMVGLYSFIQFFSTSRVIKGMIAAVVPIVAVMLGVMAYEFGEKAIKGLGWVAGITFFVISFLLLQTFSVHPAIVIFLFLLYGAFHHKLKDKWKKRRLGTGEDA